MSYAFNISRLNSLKLWNCPHSLDLLKAIVSSGRTLMLRSFEPVIDSGHDEVEIHADTITGFLEAFKGLEDLFLMFAEPIRWKKSWRPSIQDIVSEVLHHPFISNIRESSSRIPSPKWSFLKI
jgi:hypothetical protein